MSNIRTAKPSATAKKIETVKTAIAAITTMENESNALVCWPREFAGRSRDSSLADPGNRTGLWQCGQSIVDPNRFAL